MTKIKVFLVVLFIVSGLVFTSGVVAQEPLRLATGQPGDFYWVMGTKMADLWTEGGIPTEVIITDGSRENLELLSTGEADIALISGPILGEYLKVTTPKLVTLSALWPSAIHFLIFDDLLESETLTDFDRRRIYIGEEGDWREETIATILADMGISPKSLMKTIREIELIEIITDRIKRELDGAILISPAPDPLVEGLISGTGDRLVPISTGEGELSELSDTGIPLFVITIPEETYYYQVDALTTLAVGNFLVSRGDLPAETAYGLVKGIYENSELLKNFFPQGGLLTIENADEHLILPLHPGVRDYIEGKGEDKGD